MANLFAQCILIKLKKNSKEILNIFEERKRQKLICEMFDARKVIFFKRREKSVSQGLF